MTPQTLSNEMFQQIVVTLFEPAEIKFIAHELIKRLGNDSKEIISVGAKRFNLPDDEFFAALIQEKIVSISNDWLTPEEKISFSILSQFIN
ncbi:MAG TPA: hypothetical protein VKR53_09060 [Puia sp.]|nr:hypothetical protein [Puia sp.]